MRDNLFELDWLTFMRHGNGYDVFHSSEVAEFWFFSRIFRPISCFSSPEILTKIPCIKIVYHTGNSGLLRTWVFPHWPRLLIVYMPFNLLWSSLVKPTDWFNIGWCEGRSWIIKFPTIGPDFVLFAFVLKRTFANAVLLGNDSPHQPSFSEKTLWCNEIRIPLWTLLTAVYKNRLENVCWTKFVGAFSKKCQKTCFIYLSGKQSTVLLFYLDDQRKY